MNGAIAVTREAALQAEQEFGPEDPRFVRAQLVLSSLLLQTGEMGEALSLAESAHETSEGLLSEARSRVANTLKYLGNFEMMRGNLDAAEENFVRAVELAELAHGFDHPETAKHIGNLAAIALNKQEIDRASELLERALEIWDKQPSPDPVYTVTALSNLAAMRLGQGDGEAALALYAEAIAIQEQAFGEGNPRLANQLGHYSRALRDLGRTEEADAVDARIEGLVY